MKGILSYLMAGIVAVIAAIPAHAQDASGGNGHAMQSARTGKLHRVHVMESTSNEEKIGDLLELSAETVRVVVDGRVQEFRLDDVRWVEREGDSLNNGAIIGAAVMGTLCALVCAQGLDDGSGLASAVAVNTAVGALAGVAIDAMNRGRTNLYRNADDVAGAARSRRIVAFRVRF